MDKVLDYGKLASSNSSSCYIAINISITNCDTTHIHGNTKHINKCMGTNAQIHKRLRCSSMNIY